MKLFKMSCRNIGQAGKILADSGYQGLMKIYPQAQTPRKSSKLKPLTVEDKAYNHALSKERSKVENIFAKVEMFKMFSTTYRNHRKRFGLRMNLIAGFTILHSQNHHNLDIVLATFQPNVRDKLLGPLSRFLSALGIQNAIHHRSRK
ncbi:transposase-like protein, IS1381 ISSpn7 [Streptococcus pneumoniae]|nr:transposase-like protein, IS1381 ISSpn7 [Streptococcus pneumoniae]